MVLQSSGPISFSQIEAEFGQNNGRDLGEYRVTQTVDSITRNLDNGIPGSGSISFQNFYGKRLNVIVRYNSNQNRPSRARAKYDANSGVVVIGGFRSRPNNGGNGVKVFIHVSATIGSTRSNNRDVCALRTGIWNNNVHLNVDLGGGGQIRGAGGNGGKGGNDDGSNGQSGQNGNSALGVDHNLQTLVVESGCKIHGGGGGGGGGGGARMDDAEVAGGGGGGGYGVPAGIGGDDGDGNGGQNGQNGNANDGGNGGNGDEQEDNAASGGGGGGGGFPNNSEGGEGGTRGIKSQDNAQNGFDGTTSKGGNGGDGDAEGGNQAEGDGANGGNNGYAIVIRSGRSIGSISGSSRIKGGTRTATPD